MMIVPAEETFALMDAIREKRCKTLKDVAWQISERFRGEAM
jgi:hypothetical protein